MKDKAFIFFVVAMLLMSFAMAEIYDEDLVSSSKFITSDNANLRVTNLRYEPYPVNPGEYFTLWIKAENMGNEATKDTIFKLIPKYPFSLDSNEDAVKSYGSLISNEPLVVEYKVRVDRDAVEGENEIVLQYSNDGGESWIEKTFDITLDDAQTDFDLVVQEVSDDDEATIALANTGKNVAYSVIVRIPKQDDYEASGINGQMVGNLENGDYTLVSFEISKISRALNPDLQVQIDYTDLIGERRSVIKNVSYVSDTNTSSFGNLNRTGMVAGMDPSSFASRRGNFTQTQSASVYQTWWFWSVVVVALFGVFKGYKHVRRKQEEKEMREYKKSKK